MYKPSVISSSLSRSSTASSTGSTLSLVTALEAVGILPVYTCGEPRRTFVSEAAEGVHARYACATATVEARDAVTDANNAVRTVRNDVQCSPNQLTLGQPRLEVDALVEMPKPDAAEDKGT